MPIKLASVEYIDLSELDPELDRLKITLEDQGVLYFAASNPTKPRWLYVDFEQSDDGPVDRLVQRIIGNHRCGTDPRPEPWVRQHMTALIEVWKPGMTAAEGYQKPLIVGGVLSVLAGPDQWGDSNYSLGRIAKIECVELAAASPD